MYYEYIQSPIGRLLLAGNGAGLCKVGFPTGKGLIEPESDWLLEPHCCSAARQQLEEYFAGKRKQFDLDLVPQGTEFQLAVLNALQDIPWGATRSYQDIARQIGRPKAVRAVGAANGRNPLPIVIPCHRVIGANGSLTGFGGGLEAKSYLLALEQVDTQGLA
ncbi:MAG: methylated-DNA--[protein]-cysteine S-methyltransferase [Pseudomonadales bacterium]|nr:methylated-DNA--[protein]-cysteine S-methyltransferase [Pseudomonadales bacterium]